MSATSDKLFANSNLPLTSAVKVIVRVSFASAIARPVPTAILFASSEVPAISMPLITPKPVPKLVPPTKPPDEVPATSSTNAVPLSVIVKFVPATRLFNSRAVPVACPNPIPVPVLSTEVRPAPPDAPVLVAFTNAFSLAS